MIHNILIASLLISSSLQHLHKNGAGSGSGEPEKSIKDEDMTKCFFDKVETLTLPGEEDNKNEAANGKIINCTNGSNFYYFEKKEEIDNFVNNNKKTQKSTYVITTFPVLLEFDKIQICKEDIGKSIKVLFNDKSNKNNQHKLKVYASNGKTKEFYFGSKSEVNKFINANCR